VEATDKSTKKSDKLSYKLVVLDPVAAAGK
jgi:hypothetical protein